jgi:hypothetical protein
MRTLPGFHGGPRYPCAWTVDPVSDYFLTLGPGKTHPGADIKFVLENYTLPAYVRLTRCCLIRTSQPGARRTPTAARQRRRCACANIIYVRPIVRLDFEIA